MDSTVSGHEPLLQRSLCQTEERLLELIGASLLAMSLLLQTTIHINIKGMSGSRFL